MAGPFRFTKSEANTKVTNGNARGTMQHYKRVGGVPVLESLAWRSDVQAFSSDVQIIRNQNCMLINSWIMCNYKNITEMKK